MKPARLVYLLTLLILLGGLIPAAIGAMPVESAAIDLSPGGAVPRQQQPSRELSSAKPPTFPNPTGSTPLRTPTSPPQIQADVDLVLDDGSVDNDIGIGGTWEFIWLNRFTPDPGAFPFQLEEVQVYFDALGLAQVGDDIIIVVYENTAGGYDPAPGSNWLLSYPTTVQAVDAWNSYLLPAPVLLNGPGDVLIGVIALEIPGTSYWPAAIDQTTTQQRSWAGWWSTSPPPDPPLLPPDDSWILIDDYFPGNWMIRGYGTFVSAGRLHGYVMDSETGDVDPTCTDAVVHIEPGGINVPVDPLTGYYGIGLISGTYDVSASALGYSTEGPYPVVITTGLTETLDFNLWRPVIEVAPTNLISITAYITTPTTYPLTITNLGHMPLDWEILEIPTGVMMVNEAAPRVAPGTYRQPVAAWGIDPFILDELTASPDGRTEVFVAFKETADLSGAYNLPAKADKVAFVRQALRSAADTAQAEVRRWLDEQGIAYTVFYVDNTLLIRADRATIDALAAFPEVAGFHGNHVYSIMPIESEPQAQPEAIIPWDITMMQIDRVWDELGVTGEGVIVANVDTGADYDHEALYPNYLCGSGPHTDCWYDPDGGSTTPYDNNGHGTGTISQMAADNDPAFQYAVGGAPDAGWVACLGCPGGSCPDTALNGCADWLVMTTPNTPDVVNNSWGTWDALCDPWYDGKIAAYRAAGVVPVWAAGNIGNACNTSTPPANSIGTLAVGATTPGDVQASFSSTGPGLCTGRTQFPDVSAPGDNTCAAVTGGGYACNFGGTSFAAPRAAGCLALIKSADPSLGVQDLMDVIMATADNKPNSDCGTPQDDPNYRYGEGRVNCYAAVSSIIQQQDIPWVWEDPISGTVPGPGAQTIDVTFHCTETQDYTGTLRIMHSDPCEGPVEIPIVLHCQEPLQVLWDKWIDGIPWYPDIWLTRETTDTIVVIDVIHTPLLQDLQLLEFWNPDELQLQDFVFEPPFAPMPIVGPDSLTWEVPPGLAEVYTITKWFHVEACTWTNTVLWEELLTDDWMTLIGERPVPIEKLPPDLWIDSTYDPVVYAGQLATFTLSYGNTGGRENAVVVANAFPAEALFFDSTPPPDAWDPGGTWAEWWVGDLDNGAMESIDVVVIITETAPPSMTIDVWDWIYNHVGEPMDMVTTTFHVEQYEFPDLGDAPDSFNHSGFPMTAYPAGGPPGVMALFPTVFAVPGPFGPGPLHLNPGGLIAWLGPNLTWEFEADIGPDQDPTNNIIPPNDIPDLDWADDGVLFPPSLPHCAVETMLVTVTVAPGAPAPPLWLNVWYDWGRNGDWIDVFDCGGGLADEWAVQNLPLGLLPPGIHVFPLPILPWNPNAGDPLWARVTLSEQPALPGGAGPAGGYVLGETEDYYLEYPCMYGVQVEPSSTAQYGDPGATVTYTLYVTNTGNCVDTFNVAVSGNSWPTNAPTPVGPLAAGTGTSIDVTVDIPDNANCGDVDLATVTATSQNDPTQSDAFQSTTTANAVYGVLAGPDDAQSGDPDTSVVYTVWVTNTGNCTDTLDVAITGNAWPTTPAAVTVGPLAAGASGSLEVTVDIPTDAQCGDDDTATVTFTSQNDAAATDSADLTTAANTVSGVVIEPPADEQSGAPGETVTYTLRVTNTGNCTDTFDLAVGGNLWPTNLAASVGPLAAGAGDDVAVTVDIPGGANDGDFDVATVTATSQLDPLASASAVLTTTAVVPCVEITAVDLTVVTTGTIYPDTLVEFEADITPDDFTPPYSYTIEFGDGSPPTAGSSSDDPLAFDHTYTAVGTYTVELAAWNCEMTTPVTDIVEVVVYEPGVCVDLTAITIAGPTSGTPGTYTFTTSYEPPDASLPIVYLWDNGDTSHSSSRFLDVGAHLLVVTATNCTAALVTDTHVIVIEAAPVCTEVTGVDLTVVTTGTIYPGDPVAFSADISPDDAEKPYSYRLTIDGTPGSVMASSDDPLLFGETFATTGTHSVAIAVWNCDMTEPEAVTDTIEVVVYEPGVCVDLTAITIAGPTSGAPGSYTFTTSYEPPGASLPIVYLWDNGDTAASSIRLLGAGTYTLVVTATNCTQALVTGTHTVVISTPLNYIYLPIIYRIGAP